MRTIKGVVISGKKKRKKKKRWEENKAVLPRVV